MHNYHRRQETTNTEAQSVFSASAVALMLECHPATLRAAMRRLGMQPAEVSKGEKYYSVKQVNEIGRHLNETLGEWTFFYGKWRRKKCSK